MAKQNFIEAAPLIEVVIYIASPSIKDVAFFIINSGISPISLLNKDIFYSLNLTSDKKKKKGRKIIFLLVHSHYFLRWSISGLNFIYWQISSIYLYIFLSWADTAYFCRIQSMNIVYILAEFAVLEIKDVSF